MPALGIQNISNSNIVVKFSARETLDSPELRRGVLAFAICAETLLMRSQLPKLGCPRPINNLQLVGLSVSAISSAMEKTQRRFGAGISVWLLKAVAEEGCTRGPLARGLCEAADWRNAKGQGRGVNSSSALRIQVERADAARHAARASGNPMRGNPRKPKPERWKPILGSSRIGPPNRRMNAEPVQSLDAISPDLYLQKHRERLHSRSEAGLHSATWVWD